ncbi:MAG TPA: hypothetical protein VJM82_05940 [Nitrospiraceae bacterium]|nr:hypothetical protein [Nitrospiraceae bacterium]
MPDTDARCLRAIRPTLVSRKAASLFASLLTSLLCSILTGELSPAYAEIRTVTAQGEHRMGDRDTREDAIRLATEAAKRKALEQVATYLESVTEVTNLDVTKDEIRTYTAGVVLVLNQQVTTSLDGETVVIHSNLTAQVDTDEVVQAIAALRENESARKELVAVRAEVDQLHQQLDAANQALAAATTPEQVQEISQQRQDLLNRAQSNALVSQAWTDWVLVTPVASPFPWVGFSQVQALLTNAGRLYPANPHVQIVQQVITTQQPPVQQTTVTPPALSPAPRNLQQMFQQHPSLLMPTTPMPSSAPLAAQQGQPPHVAQSLPSPIQQTTPPQMTQSFQPRHLPPTLNQIHPPPPPHVPRVPFRYAPPFSRGGFSHGGGMGGHGGGGRRR